MGLELADGDVVARVLDSDELASGATARAGLRLRNVAARGGGGADDALRVVSGGADPDVGRDQAVLAAVRTVVQVEVHDVIALAKVDLPPLGGSVLGVRARGLTPLRCGVAVDSAGGGARPALGGLGGRLVKCQVARCGQWRRHFEQTYRIKVTQARWLLGDHQRVR